MFRLRPGLNHTKPLPERGQGHPMHPAPTPRGGPRQPDAGASGMHQCLGVYIGPAPPPGPIALQQDATGTAVAGPEPAGRDRRGGDVRGPPCRPGPLHPCTAAQRRGAALAPHARVPALRRLPRHCLPGGDRGAGAQHREQEPRRDALAGEVLLEPPNNPLGPEISLAHGPIIPMQKCFHCWASGKRMQTPAH